MENVLNLIDDKQVHRESSSNPEYRIHQNTITYLYWNATGNDGFTIPKGLSELHNICFRDIFNNKYSNCLKNRVAYILNNSVIDPKLTQKTCERFVQIGIEQGLLPSRFNGSFSFDFENGFSNKFVFQTTLQDWHKFYIQVCYLRLLSEGPRFVVNIVKMVDMYNFDLFSAMCFCSLISGFSAGHFFLKFHISREYMIRKAESVNNEKIDIVYVWFLKFICENDENLRSIESLPNRSLSESTQDFIENSDIFVNEYKKCFVTTSSLQNDEQIKDIYKSKTIEEFKLKIKNYSKKKT